MKSAELHSPGIALRVECFSFKHELEARVVGNLCYGVVLARVILFSECSKCITNTI